MEKISLWLFLAAILCSCAAEREAEENGPVVETVETDFAAGSRADLGVDPQYGDAYTFISYNVGGTSSAEIFRNQVAQAWQCGYYAYDDGVQSGRPAGTFVPVAVKVPNATDRPPFVSTAFYRPSLTPLTIDRTQAQRLSAAPAGGLNPTTNVGLYHTAVIYPAIPVHSTGIANLGHLAVYHVGTEIWASNPDDADGDPDTVDPFEILVNTNRMIHPLPEPTKLFPVKAGIKVWFYSEYFSGDPWTSSPRTQAFEITSLKLVNVGSNGWYNARTGIVYPNYNHRGGVLSGTSATNWRTVYSPTEIGVNPDGTPTDTSQGAYNFADLLDPNHDGNPDDSLLEDERGNTLLPPQRPGYPPPTEFIQWSAQTPVFPSDYRGAENGGVAQVKPLSLRIELTVNGATLKASAPIAMRMEHGKQYNIYVNVMSELIRISYNVSAWGTGGGSDDIGGDMGDYVEIPVEYRPDGWIVVDGGNDIIGN